MNLIRSAFYLLLTMAYAIAQATPRPVIDHVTLQLSDSLAFTIPITNPKWEQYKGYLPSLTLNSNIWDKLNATMSRTDLEIRLHDEIGRAYLNSVATARKQNAPLIQELTQAAFTAGRPGATPDQLAYYQQVNAKDAPILNQTTRPLMAIKLLLLAMQADIHVAPGYSGLYNGQVVAKPVPPPGQ